MLNDHYEFNIAGHYLSALVNGDYTGLEDNEAAAFNAFMEPYSALKNMTIDVADNESQFARDAVTDLMADCYTVRFYFTNDNA